jgi:hypothetical protein
MSPLSNRLQIGEEAFVVVVAEGEGGLGDLYALPAGGGAPLQITFTRVDESHPALTADGSVLAFIRAGQKTGGQPVVVLMNLLNGAERRVELPPGSAPVRVAWSRDQTGLFIQTTTGMFSATAPPNASAAAPVGPADSAAADSALAVVLGTPAFATAGPCRSTTSSRFSPSAAGICVRCGRAEFWPECASRRMRRGRGGGRRKKGDRRQEKRIEVRRLSSG